MALISHGEWLDRFGDDVGEAANDKPQALTYSVLPAWVPEDMWVPWHGLGADRRALSGPAPVAVRPFR